MTIARCRGRPAIGEHNGMNAGGGPRNQEGLVGASGQRKSLINDGGPLPTGTA